MDITNNKYYKNKTLGKQNEIETIKYSIQIHQSSNYTKLAKYDITSTNYALCDVEFDNSYRDRSFCEYVYLYFSHYIDINGNIVPVGFVDKYNKFSQVDESEIKPDYMMTVGKKPSPVNGLISSFLLNHDYHKPNAYKVINTIDGEKYYVKLKIPFSFVDVETYKEEISQKKYSEQMNKNSLEDIINDKNKEIEELKNIIYSLQCKT